MGDNAISNDVRKTIEILNKKINFCEFLLENFGIFLFFVVSNAFLIIWFYCINLGFGIDALNFIKSPFISTIFLFLVLFLLFYYCFKIKKFRKLGNILVVGGGIYTLLVVILDSFYILNFNSFLNAAAIDSVKHTNFNETLEFIEFYFNFKSIFIPILIAFCLLFLLKIKIKARINAKINLFFIAFILIFFFANDIRRSVVKNDFTRFMDIPVINLSNLVFFDDEVFLNLKTIQRSFLKIAQNHEKIKFKEDIKNVILIIGESSRRDVYDFYKLNKMTDKNLTPNLNLIQNKIAFSDVVAPYPYTSGTMSVLLNFTSLKDLKIKKYYESLDIVSFFKLAGFKTFWLSNQDYASTTAGLSNNADFEMYINKNVEMNTLLRLQKLDGELLDFLPKLKLSKNNFIVLHLLQNHGIYTKRYPKNYEIINKKDILRPDLNDDDKQTIAQYFNSVLYSDFVISQIYDFFKNDDSLVIYLSDHGEILKDSKNYPTFAHGFVDKMTADIPFVVMYSDVFKAKHPKLLNKIENAKNKPFMSDDLMHLLCDIISCDAVEFDKTKSPINDSYNENRPRVIANEKDYETLLNN